MFNIINRLIAAFLTIPDIQAWVVAVLLLLIYALISLPIGFKFEFLKLDILTWSGDKIVKLLAICLFTPAITEEIFFRVLLLPHPSENASVSAQWIWGFISLVIFIVYHPVNALTFYPDGIKTFFNPVFLLLAALLGIICAIVYLQSGSLWLPVLIHWLIVVIWLILLGGYKRLHS